MSRNQKTAGRTSEELSRRSFLQHSATAPGLLAAAAVVAPAEGLVPALADASVADKPRRPPNILFIMTVQ